MSKHNARFLFLLVTTGALFMLGGIGLSAVTTDDVETNRRVLQEIRANNPEYYVRLQRRYEHFRALTADEQQRVRQLDHGLFEREPQTQARLLRSLEEYVAWLTRLPEHDRQRVLSAGSRQERLNLIQAMRLEQWIDHLPAAQKDELQHEPNEKKRLAALDKWRREEIAWRLDWTDVRRYSDVLRFKGPNLPFHDKSFRAEVASFVDNKLKPMLSPEELAGLSVAWNEQGTPGRPYLWFRTVVNLSEKHPVLGLEPRYKSLATLPGDYQRLLTRMPPTAEARLKTKEGKWPDFALEVMDYLRRRAEKSKDFKELKIQLGPCRPEDFPPPVQNFIQNSLNKALTDSAEKEKLGRAQGHWPDYPLVLHELARKHNLPIPELTLPGPPQEWDWFRQPRLNAADK